MRHRKNVNKLNRTSEHRKALLANLATSLFEKKRIKTTHAKAKAAQQFVERLITLAKKDTLHARRLVLSRLRHKSAMQVLFNDIAPTFKERNGGYTRVVRLGNRPGDGAEISILELVGFEEAMKKKAKEKKEKESKKAEKTEAKVKETPAVEAAEAEVVEQTQEKKTTPKKSKPKTAKTKIKKPVKTEDKAKEKESPEESTEEPSSEPEEEKK